MKLILIFVKNLTVGYLCFVVFLRAKFIKAKQRLKVIQVSCEVLCYRES